MMKKNFKKRLLAGALSLMLAAGVCIPAAPVRAADTVLPNATNTSMANARELVFDNSVAEQTSGNDQYRYYKFTLDEPSMITLEGNDGDEIYFKIYDQTQTEIWTDTAWGDSGRTFPFSLKLYLTGGSYYLCVQCSCEFNFKAAKNPLGDTFKETQDNNNDMPGKASSIDIKSSYKGVLASNDTIDYYKFNMPANGKINLATTNATDNTIRYIFYDDSLNCVYDTDLGSNQQKSDFFEMTSGDYYLAITQRELGKGVGSYTFTLDYKQTKPAKTSALRCSAKKGRKMTVTWAQTAGCTGYRVQYAKSASFKKGLVEKEVTSDVTSLTFKKLQKKKTYYVRVSAYAEVNGETIYGAWSSVKRVKIKK